MPKMTVAEHPYILPITAGARKDFERQRGEKNGQPPRKDCRQRSTSESRRRGVERKSCWRGSTKAGRAFGCRSSCNKPVNKIHTEVILAIIPVTSVARLSKPAASFEG